MDEGRGEVLAGEAGRQKLECGRGQSYGPLGSNSSWRRARGTSGLVGANDFLYPGGILADLCVDSWVLSRATGVNAPGKGALQGVPTDQRAPGVTLGWEERESE